ncbi:hypothetical protein GYB22_06645 [bacterium]|nr:hypothetical protein [bacterium]
MRKQHRLYFLLVLVLLQWEALAQLNLGGGSRLTGTTNFHYQFYNTQSINNGTGNIRQPKHLPQFSGIYNLHLAKGFDIPIQLYLRPVVQVNAFGVNTPAEGPKSLTILEYLSHPVNRIYLNPKYKNFEFHIGHFIQPYSELSSGDIKVFGLGFGYDAGAWSIAAQRGMIQPLVVGNAFNTRSTYRRSLNAVSFGRNLSEDLLISVSLSLVGDNKNSLDSVPMFTRPERSAALAVNGNYKINQKHRLFLELANTAYAPNTLATDTLREFSVPSILIPSTNVFAGFGLLSRSQHQFEKFKLKNKLEWKSRNFRTLAYPFMQSDLLRVEVNPSFSLFENALQSNINFGFLGSNISDPLIPGLIIPNLKYAGTYKYNKHLFVNGAYAFNAVNGELATGQRINTFNQVIRIMPTYLMEWMDIKHTITGIFGLSTYKNSSDFLPTVNQIRTTNFGIVYRAVYEQYSGGVSINSFTSARPQAKLFRNTTITLNATRRFESIPLSPYIRFTFTNAKSNIMNELTKTGSRRVFQCGARYRVNSKISSSLGLSTHYIKNGIIPEAPAFREFLLRAAVTYKL